MKFSGYIPYKLFLFSLAFSVCLSLIYVSLCQYLSSCVCMCFSEPFFIYLCLTLFDSTYLYFYFCLSPFLGLHYQISWIIKLCIGIYIFITSLPPHKWKRTWLSYHVSITFVLYVFCYYYRFKCKTHLSPPSQIKRGVIWYFLWGRQKKIIYFIALEMYNKRKIMKPYESYIIDINFTS